MTLSVISFTDVHLKVIISHNNEFVSALCEFFFISSEQSPTIYPGPEIWNVEAGKLTHQGKVAVVEDVFADVKSPKGSGANTPVRSRLQTPAGSASVTPAGSGAEDNSGLANAFVKRKKKKPTRNMVKAQEERRRLRKLHWLTHGGPKPEDTDSDIEL
jgi:elongation factor 3